MEYRGHRPRWRLRTSCLCTSGPRSPRSGRHTDRSPELPRPSRSRSPLRPSCPTARRRAHPRARHRAHPKIRHRAHPKIRRPSHPKLRRPQSPSHLDRLRRSRHCRWFRCCRLRRLSWWLHSRASLRRQRLYPPHQWPMEAKPRRRPVARRRHRNQCDHKPPRRKPRREPISLPASVLWLLRVLTKPPPYNGASSSPLEGATNNSRATKVELPREIRRSGALGTSRPRGRSPTRAGRVRDPGIRRHARSFFDNCQAGLGLLPVAQPLADDCTPPDHRFMRGSLPRWPSASSRPSPGRA
jgi:hypothetical protein